MGLGFRFAGGFRCVFVVFQWGFFGGLVRFLAGF